MATPRRRSSRLRNNSPQKHDLVATPQSKLTTLDERDERPDATTQFYPVSPTHQSSARLRTVTSPTAGTSMVKTPANAGRVQPDREEMHPSYYQSTAKRLASGIRAGSVNSEMYAQSPTQTRESFTVIASPEDVKPTSPTRKSFASPDFEFRFRQSTDMSSEAQRIMDEVREQATRIKEGLAVHREEQMRKDDEADALFGRKIATPKGKMGRFSDIHVQSFKKMNSIANHPSAFRMEPPKYLPSAQKLLKRSNSKAGLDKPEGGVGRVASSKGLHTQSSEDCESPAKRFKQRHNQALASRPSFGQGGIDASKAANAPIQRAYSGIPTLSSIAPITTPTKASLARSASVKSLKTKPSIIPSITQSPSTKTLSTPSVPRTLFPHTEGSRKYRTSLAHKFTSFKSILRRPQIRFSDDPNKLAAGTHVSTPEASTATHDMKLLPPFANIMDALPGSLAHHKEKHVNFPASPSTVVGPSQPDTPTSPSPVKMPGGYPSLYPSIPAEDMGPTSPIVDAGLSLPSVRASVAGPPDFTFRSNQTLSFAPRTVNAQANTTPTIRRVRASDTSALAGVNIQPLSQLPSVPHGLSNKKRKRISDEVSGKADDKENDAKKVEEHEDGSKPAKKARMTMDLSRNAGTARKAKLPLPASRIPKRKGNGILSLSRLHALAKPKDRK